MAKRQSTFPDYHSRDVSQTDLMYMTHQQAMVPQFNAYRVDLDIILIEYRGTVVAYDDGAPLLSCDYKDLGTASFTEKVKELIPAPRCDFGLACKFLGHSMSDRLDSEKMVDSSDSPWVNYVAIRKEFGAGSVSRRLWFDRYDPRNMVQWPFQSPILDVNNHPINVFGVNIYGNRLPTPGAPVGGPLGYPPYPTPMGPTPLPRFYGPAHDAESED